MKSAVIFALKISGLSSQELENLIEIPKDPTHGDYAFACFALAKTMKKNPAVIAQELAKKIGIVRGFEKVEAVGPYVNFFVDKTRLATEVLKIIEKEGEKYGSNKEGKGKKIVVEFASPNSNKPLHLGHLRNISIGESVARILEFNKNKIARVSINNDRGVHICKSMVAYEEFGKGKTPEKEGKKSDHFVGDYYVLFSKRAADDKNYEEKAQECLRKWEMKDKKTISLWEKMNTWAFDGFRQTYKTFGVSFNKEYYESQIYTKGKEIVDAGLKKGIFQKRDDGAVIINLEKEGLGEKVLLRADGTSVYITQDLYLAKLKYNDYKLDSSIYVVANEQDYHFKVLFAILNKLGFSFANKLDHLSYGMVELPEGKMKSREGTVVDADDLIANVQQLVKDELNERYKLSKKELEDRSLAIALAAIKYTLLKQDIRKPIIFNPKEAIHFEGDTGPYLLYSYARAHSILRKAGLGKRKNIENVPVMHEREQSLVKELGRFGEVVRSAALEMSPAAVAHYAFGLAQTFNEFYHACAVIGSAEEVFRVRLVRAFVQVLGNALHLLGIPVLKEM